MTRWNRRLLFGAMAVLVPALAGCEAGFNAPTLQYHPANFTANTTQDGISLSNVFVLGASTSGPEVAGGRAGVFLSLYARTATGWFRSSAPGAASSVSIAGGSVNLPAQSLVSLSGPVPKVVLTGLTNPLQGGEAVTLSFTFAKAGTITISVPVEPQTLRVRDLLASGHARARAVRQPRPSKTARCPRVPAPHPTAWAAPPDRQPTASASNRASGQRARAPFGR